MQAIELNGCSFSYLDARKQSIFNLSIDKLHVNEGEFLSILGPNGCGKSTLLKIISRILSVNSGELKIFGKNINQYKHAELAKTIAYVKQSNTMVFPFSVYEIVMMGRTPYLNLLGFENAQDRDIVSEAMTTMQIDHLANKGINEVSGGEAQRVYIARALAQKSKIILLDEPNAHLDLEHQIMIFELVQKLNRENGITIVNISHDLNLVGVFTDRVVIMENGMITEDGGKMDILTSETIKKYFHVHTQIINLQKESLNVLVDPRDTSIK